MAIAQNIFEWDMSPKELLNAAKYCLFFFLYLKYKHLRRNIGVIFCNTFFIFIYQKPNFVNY